MRELRQARQDDLAGKFKQKWRGRGQLPAGKNADDYLRLIRDGDSH